MNIYKYFLPLFLFTAVMQFAMASANSGLAVQNAGSDMAYLSHIGEPLLAFGCHLEHMFFDDYDVEQWTDWAASHGMNHCRARLYHGQHRKYSPFLQTSDGRYDLTSWDPVFWERFHKICSLMEEHGIIIHLLIFPQGTGGYWWQGDGYYAPENNIHPETAFIRSQEGTAGWWQSLAKGQTELYEIQTAILWKLVEESARYGNIYYDLCHEPFFYAMTDEAQADALVFFEETTRRFHEKYSALTGGRAPILGFDTDFVPAGPTRDWIYKHDRFNIMIQGNNSETYYTSPFQSVDLRTRYKKPFCPQESCDLPRIDHIPGSGHPQNLTYFYPHHRVHLRKYVWRWMMAKSQLIDIYQKGMGNVARVYADCPEDDPIKKRMLSIQDKERYTPAGHNRFEEDARILRQFWNALEDYPNLAIQGNIVGIHFKYVRRVLSSDKEAVVYLSSEPGKEGVELRSRNLKVINLGLEDGEYSIDVWKPDAKDGIIGTFTRDVRNGIVPVPLPAFVDDIAVHIH